MTLCVPNLIGGRGDESGLEREGDAEGEGEVVGGEHIGSGTESYGGAVFEE